MHISSSLICLKRETSARPGYRSLVMVEKARLGRVEKLLEREQGDMTYILDTILYNTAYPAASDYF